MQDLITEYRDLVSAEESLPTLDRAITLARRIASGTERPRRGRWLNILNGQASGNLVEPARSNSQTARRVRDVIWVLSTLLDRAERYNVPEAQYSLLMDTLLVVFHQAYFALLPKAKADRTLLLDAFQGFSEKIPALADRFRLAALVEIERGNPEAACEAFRASLVATPSDQHDFLTRVQMVWSTLMDHHLVSEAFACLQDVEPRVTRIDFGEFQGLLRSTFVEAQRR